MPRIVTQEEIDNFRIDRPTALRLGRKGRWELELDIWLKLQHELHIHECLRKGINPFKDPQSEEQWRESMK